MEKQCINKNTKNSNMKIIQERQQEVAVTFVAFEAMVCTQRTGRNPKLPKKAKGRSQMNICDNISHAISETQLSRQITPRTKNGHAPPITQS